MQEKRFQFLVSLLVVVAFVASFALSACGAPAGGAAAKSPAPVSESGRASPQSPAPTAGPARQASPPAAGVAAQEITVTLKSNIFPKQIRVKAGSRVIFVVTNEEREHKHSVEFPDFTFYHEVGPRETVRIEWVVPDKKGKWDMGCYLTEPSDAHDGMVGDLIIE